MQRNTAITTGKNAARNAGFVALCIGLALVVCNIIRIVSVPLTCDESPSRSDLLLSYRDYIQLNKVTANIHILNSILRKASIEAFGNTPFFLRLPNLLAQVLFLFCCYGLVSRLFKEGRWRIAAFAACNLNPFLFEFWGYSRGYGLAIAFMMASMYLLVRYLEDKKTMHIWLALAAAAASVWSNFALLNYYLGLCGALIVHGLFLDLPRTFAQKALPALAFVSGGLFLLIYSPLKKLQTSGELYYGGDRGLISDTVKSLVKESLFISDPARPAVKYASYFLVLLVAMLIVYWAVALFRRPRDLKRQTGVVLCLLLAVPLLSLVAQHQLLGTKYLIDRTALFIIVLTVINIIYWLYCLRRENYLVSEVALFVMTGALAVNFFQHLTFRKSRTWWFDNYNVTVLNRIAAGPHPHGRRIKLRVAWMQQPSLEYYVYTRHNALFEPLEYTKEGPGPLDTSYDFCYLPIEFTGNIALVYMVDTSFDATYFLYKKR